MQIQDIKSYVEATSANIAAGGVVKFWAALALVIPAEILGVSTKMIGVLVMLSVIDFITGIVRAKMTKKKISSSKAANTLFKGLMYAALIFASWGVSLIFNDYVHIHFLAVSFLILVEFHSVLENITEAGILLPAPVNAWLKDKLNLHEEPRQQQ